ncbi:MAG: DHA2 family efflux MFS transporter permease subunit [Sterolibacterium sp.]|nr:DHA2 family efflux MFS transporter permease subunit [Sterolibacterium sp.]
MSPAFRPAHPGLCKVGLALASFMQVLDSTIANVSLPTIAGNLGSTAQQSTWVVTSFAVGMAIALPLTGWLVRRIGEVRLFIATMVLFTLSSVLCGAAANLGMLIVFRALQGFVSGPIYPVTQALMISLFPDNRRAQAIVVIALVSVVAPILGPILGGWITDNYNWPWIFFINVPVGVFACYVVWSQMRHKPEEQTQRARMDYVGLISLAIGVGALQILLDKGNDEDWFNSNFIITAAITAAISMAVFLIWELTERDPIVDLHIFRHRNFTVGSLCYMLAFGVFFGGSVLVPLWLQTQLHYTPLWAGMAVAPQGFFPLLLGPLIGKYAHRLNLRLLTSMAFVAMAIPYFLRSTFNMQVDFATVVYVQLFQGIGVALFFMPIMTILLSDLKPEEISAGSGLAMFLRTLGCGFSVSISNYLWNTRAVLHHSQLAERFTPGSAGAVEALGSLGHGNTQLALTRLDQIITGQAYQISFNEIFLGFTMVLLGLVLMIWLAKPPFSGNTVNVGSDETDHE